MAAAACTLTAYNLLPTTYYSLLPRLPRAASPSQAPCSPPCSVTWVCPCLIGPRATASKILGMHTRSCCRRRGRAHLGASSPRSSRCFTSCPSATPPCHPSPLPAVTPYRAGASPGATHPCHMHHPHHPQPPPRAGAAPGAHGRC
eukprot:scaffold6809_cov56-Phaeocystis_antarctica.AAC.5